jgi:hypothetical protein
VKFGAMQLMHLIKRYKTDQETNNTRCKIDQETNNTHLYLSCSKNETQKPGKPQSEKRVALKVWWE